MRRQQRLQQIDGHLRLAGHRGRASLDQPGVARERAGGILRDQPPGEPSGRRPVLARSAEAAARSQRVVGPRVVGRRVGDLKEPRLRFLGTIQLAQRLGRSEQQRRPRRRARVPLQDGVGGRERRLRPMALHLDRRQLEGRLRRQHAAGLRGQSGQQARGVVSPAHAPEGSRTPQSGLAPQRTRRRRPLHGLEGLDSLGRPTGRQLVRADLIPGAVDPLRAPLPRQLAEQAERPVPLAGRHQGPAQPVASPVGQPPARMIGQRALVSLPRRGQILLREIDVAQVGPGGLHRRMVGLARRERLEGPARRRQVARDVRELAHPIPDRACSSIPGAAARKSANARNESG